MENGQSSSSSLMLIMYNTKLLLIKVSDRAGSGAAASVLDRRFALFVGFRISGSFPFAGWEVQSGNQRTRCSRFLIESSHANITCEIIERYMIGKYMCLSTAFYEP